MPSFESSRARRFAIALTLTVVAASGCAARRSESGGSNVPTGGDGETRRDTTQSAGPAPTPVTDARESAAVATESAQPPIADEHTHPRRTLLIVRCVFTAEGRVTDCHVLQSGGATDKAVIESLMARRYTPVMQDGKPISTTKVFNIRLEAPQGPLSSIPTPQKE